MTFKELIEQAEDGTLNMGKLRALAMRVTGNSADAEDAVQEALIQCWHYATQDKPVEDAEQYLYRMVRYKAVDIVRARRTDREVEGELAAIGHHPSPEERLLRQAEVDEAMGALSDRQWEVFSLVVIDHATQEEAADELGISQSAVAKHLTRAWARMHEAREAARQGRRGK